MYFILEDAPEQEKNIQELGQKKTETYKPYSAFPWTDLILPDDFRQKFELEKL